MDLSFKNKKLEALCSRKSLQLKQLGKPCAKKLQTRLADLLAAKHVKQLVAGGPHALTGDRAGQYAVSLHGGFRLVFEPAHDTVPQLPDGGIDWQQVTAVRITYIGDYHD